MRILAAAALFLAACASSRASSQQQQTKIALKDAPVSSPGQARPKGREVCHMERPLGSNIPEKVCYWEGDEKDMDLNGDYTRELMSGPRGQPITN